MRINSDDTLLFVPPTEALLEDAGEVESFAPIESIKPFGHAVGHDLIKPWGHLAGAAIQHVNTVLRRHGKAASLDEGVYLGGPAGVVPVTGVVDAGEVLALLELEERANWVRDPIHFDGTFVSASKPFGHGLAFAEVTTEQLPTPPWEPLPAGLRRPVVAVLDTGVRAHAWLPAAPTTHPVLIDAEQQSPPWAPELTPGQVSVDSEPGQSKAGHATFIAGIIRQAAPSAQILSVRVMNDRGEANESTVCRALDWLIAYRQNHPVDVVCMAFGRPAGDDAGGPLVDVMKAKLKALADAGVQLVASAGNDHSDGLVYPASFDTVTAVGAGFGGYHANFSNFGDWVDRYRDGSDVLGIMPGGKWARWNGTSFAAAAFAGDLARPQVDHAHVTG
ncbi:S8 family peptidase [Actinoplanes sp. CA-030573]|uniref:S8 family peptidase n=1 Tax=Actinoplanes sp. CA-030573 TaxID=3239898 RepID=UPI003D8F56E2